MFENYQKVIQLLMLKSDSGCIHLNCSGRDRLTAIHIRVYLLYCSNKLLKVAMKQTCACIQTGCGLFSLVLNFCEGLLSDARCVRDFEE